SLPIHPLAGQRNTWKGMLLPWSPEKLLVSNGGRDSTPQSGPSANGPVVLNHRSCSHSVLSLSTSALLPGPACAPRPGPCARFQNRDVGSRHSACSCRTRGCMIFPACSSIIEHFQRHCFVSRMRKKGAMGSLVNLLAFEMCCI